MSRPLDGLDLTTHVEDNRKTEFIVNADNNKELVVRRTFDVDLTIEQTARWRSFLKEHKKFAMDWRPTLELDEGFIEHYCATIGITFHEFMQNTKEHYLRIVNDPNFAAFRLLPRNSKPGK